MYRPIVRVDDESVDDITDKDVKPCNAFVGETREEDEDEHDFYSRQLQDFISLHSCLQVSAAPARPESVILSLEHAPKLLVEQLMPHGCQKPSHAFPSLCLPPLPSLQFHLSQSLCK